jgi:hypothetical protein
MSYISIKPLNKLGEDERGVTYNFKTKTTGDFIFLTRKAGSLSGNTYHEGKNKGTNPKTFILLSGSIEFSYRHVESTTITIEIISEPSIVEIQPFVTHAVKAITDITMLEANSIQDIQEDRVRESVVIETV